VRAESCKNRQEPPRRRFSRNTHKNRSRRRIFVLKLEQETTFKSVRSDQFQIGTAPSAGFASGPCRRSGAFAHFRRATVISIIVVK
jgi:hypothetical protein